MEGGYESYEGSQFDYEGGPYEGPVFDTVESIGVRSFSGRRNTWFDLGDIREENIDDVKDTKEQQEPNVLKDLNTDRLNKLHYAFDNVSSAAPRAKRRLLSVIVMSAGSRECKQLNTVEIVDYIQKSKRYDYNDHSRKPLKLRDIRQVFAGICRFSIEPRDGCVLVNLADIKAIVTCDKTLFFAGGSDEFQSGELQIPRCFPGMKFKSIQEICDSISESYNARSSQKERVVLEILLMEICARLWTLTEPLIDASEEILTQNVEQLIEKLGQIQVLNRDIGVVQDYLSAACDALEELNEDEEDLQMLCLSAVETPLRRVIRGDEGEMSDNVSALPKPMAMEMEILLECYLQEIEAMHSKIKRADESLDDILQYVEIHLSTVRNRFLRYEIVLNCIGIFFGFLTMISGMFGMNMMSGLEGNLYAFWFVSFIQIISTCGVLAIASSFFYHKDKRSDFIGDLSLVGGASKNSRKMSQRMKKLL